MNPFIHPSIESIHPLITNIQCIIDTVVMKALNKTRRDHSIMMAAALKEEISKRGKELDNDLDETDQSRITKEVI